MNEVIFLRWTDSAIGSSAWVDREEVSTQCVTCETVGYVLARDAESITVCGSLTSGGQVMGVLTIPMVTVIEMETLKS